MYYIAGAISGIIVFFAIVFLIGKYRPVGWLLRKVVPVPTQHERRPWNDPRIVLDKSDPRVETIAVTPDKAPAPDSLKGILRELIVTASSSPVIGIPENQLTYYADRIINLKEKGFMTINYKVALCGDDAGVGQKPEDICSIQVIGYEFCCSAFEAFLKDNPEPGLGPFGSDNTPPTELRLISRFLGSFGIKFCPFCGARLTFKETARFTRVKSSAPPRVYYEYDEIPVALKEVVS